MIPGFRLLVLRALQIILWDIMPCYVPPDHSEKQRERIEKWMAAVDAYLEEEGLGK